jgi:hypothetical protein
MEQDTKYVAHLANVYFLKLLGTSRRQATADWPKEELPAEISRHLRELERQEFLQNLHAGKPKGDPAA